MYTLINGSPKSTNSNSLYFLKRIISKLENNNLYELKKDKHEIILESIKKSETLILAFPLYVDSPSSITLSFLDYIIDNKISLKNKSIYTIINCGFREGEQNITAVNIIKNWCNKTKANYKGSIMIGAGEIVGKPKYKLISRNALKKLDIFTNAIIKNNNIQDIVTTMDILNNKTYCFLANKSWNKSGKKNNLTFYDLIIK